MTTQYPAQIDNNQTLPLVIDRITAINATVINDLRAAIIGIEETLGVNPQSTFTTVRARLDALTAAITGGGGGGGFVANGDLSGTSLLQRVIGLYGIPLSSDVPAVGQYLGYNGVGWIASNIQSNQITPAYEITLSGPALVLVGATVFNPLFTASYSSNPTTAVLTDNQGTPSLNVLTAPAPSTMNQFFYTTGSGPAQYVFNSYGASVIWTLTSTSGGSTALATYSLSWTQPIYFGTAIDTGTYTSGFITGLSGTFLGLSRQTSFVVNATGGQSVWYAYRSAYGAGTFVVGGWIGGFSLVATVSLTNVNGFTENYYLYRSDFPNLGNITVNVF
jgi:hypothetical protein